MAFLPQHEVPQKTRDAVRAAHIGVPLSPEHRRRIGDALRGKPRPPMSAQGRANIAAAKLGSRQSSAHVRHRFATRAGYRHSPETRRKISEANRGNGAETSSVNELARKSVAYKEWRTHVFQRDNYTCQACGLRGGRLQADHVMPFWRYIDIRFEILNGRTLCAACHLKTPTYGGRPDPFL